MVITPRKINIEPENDGLDDDFPFPRVYSEVLCSSSGVYAMYKSLIEFHRLWLSTWIPKNVILLGKQTTFPNTSRFEVLTKNLGSFHLATVINHENFSLRGERNPQLKWYTCCSQNWWNAISDSSRTSRTQLTS